MIQPRLEFLIVSLLLLNGTAGDVSSCRHSESVNGVPNDIDLKTANLTDRLSFEDCITECCASPSCQAAVLHKGFCVMASCKTSPCPPGYSEDPKDAKAKFVFVTRQAETTETKNSTNLDGSPHEVLELKSGELSNSTTISPKSSANTTTTSTDNDSSEKQSSDQTVNSKPSEAEEVAQTTADDSVKSDNHAPSDNQQSSQSTTEDSSDKVEEKCEPKCGVHASCVSVKKAWKCACAKGFEMKNGSCVATKMTCKKDSCPAHSTCKIVNNKIDCSCNNGFKASAEKCVEVTCQNVTCPLHATCAITDNNPHCFCEKDFIAQGEFCRPDRKCTIEPKNAGCMENEHCQQVNNKLQCFCVPGKLRAKQTGDCTANASAIVLASEDVVVTLPAKSATLSVRVTPAHEKKSNYYTYKWKQESSPPGATSTVEGLTTSQVKISKLTAGSYVYQLTVIGLKNEFQSKSIKLQVKAEPHLNLPPKAVIKPAGKQTFKLPADFSLNGIDSLDDDKIISYKWTIEARPVASNDHVQLTGESTDTLHVKVDQGEGEFRFKLTVKDKGGLAGYANKSVMILAEDDFPPSAKVSTPLTLTLPKNSAALYGNDSKDDHEITRWEWTKSTDSPKTGDMTGTTSDTLFLSDLVEGTYTFTLTVYDKKDQKSSASTTVTVRPAENGPPKANAGSNKELVMPDTNTELDGTKSTSPLGPVLYHWEQISGSPKAILKSDNSSKLMVSGLNVGAYRFKLTITDKKNNTDSDEVTVTVKEDDNKPPVAIVGPNRLIHVPNTAIDIDGSNSTDDNKIVTWQWTRSGNSPALGSVVGNSDTAPVLKLCDLIVGVYKFTLTVYDEKGESSSASLTVTVEKNPHSNDIVQVYLFEDPATFTQDRLSSLTNILMVPFSNSKERAVRKWELKVISVETIDEEVVVYFYGKYDNGTLMKGKPLVDHLRKTVYGQVLGFNFDVIDTTTCSNTCSGHGECQSETRLCVCDKFWMENFFRAAAGRQFSNCAWSKIYFGLIMCLIFIVGLIAMYAVWYVFSLRNDQIRRRKKYKLLEEATGRGINNDTSDEDSDFFKMKKSSRKSSSSNAAGMMNGFNSANVLNNTKKSTDKRK